MTAKVSSFANAIRHPQSSRPPPTFLFPIFNCQITEAQKNASNAKTETLAKTQKVAQKTTTIGKATRANDNTASGVPPSSVIRLIRKPAFLSQQRKSKNMSFFLTPAGAALPVQIRVKKKLTESASEIACHQLLKT